MPKAYTRRPPPQARVLVTGKIMKSGGTELVLALAAKGCDRILKTVSV